MDDRYLRYFIAVAEELNITRAAEKLHTVQPSLSQQIRRLEEMVGVELFERDKRRLRLTEAGKVFLVEAQAMLSQTASAIQRTRQAARGVSGLMAIGFVAGVEASLFTRVLPLFRAEYPKIDVTLHSMTSPRQIEALFNQEIDLGFVRPPVSSQGLVWEEILSNRILAVVPAAHPLAKMRRIPIASLSAALPLMGVHESRSPALYNLVVEIGQKAGVRFNSILTADNFLTSLAEVGAGLGFCMAPDYIRDFAPESVAIRPLAITPQPMLPLLAVYKEESHHPVVPLFLALLRAQLQRDRENSKESGEECAESAE